MVEQLFVPQPQNDEVLCLPVFLFLLSQSCRSKRPFPSFCAHAAQSYRFAPWMQLFVALAEDSWRDAVFCSSFTIGSKIGRFLAAAQDTHRFPRTCVMKSASKHFPSVVPTSSSVRFDGFFCRWEDIHRSLFSKGSNLCALILSNARSPCHASNASCPVYSTCSFLNKSAGPCGGPRLKSEGEIGCSMHLRCKCCTRPNTTQPAICSAGAMFWLASCNSQNAAFRVALCMS